MSQAKISRIRLGAIFGLSVWRNRPIRYLILCGLTLIAAVVVSTAIMVGNLRDRALFESERGLKNTALILAEQIDRTFQGIDLVQSSVIERIQSVGITSSGDYARRMSGQDVHLMLKASTSGLVQIYAISLINADGRLINFSRFWPAPDISVADRVFFKTLKSDSRATSFISDPAHNRTNGAWTMFLARRVSAANGDFLGLVLGAVELSYFDKLFSSVSLGEGSSIALYRSDGVLLTRFPQDASFIGKVFTSPLDALGSGDSGAIRFIGQIGGKDRLLAVHRLADFPMFLSVGVDTSSALAVWQKQTDILFGAGALAALTVAIMVLLIVRQLAQEHTISMRRMALEKQRLDMAINNMSQGLVLFDAEERLVVCNDLYIAIMQAGASQPTDATSLASRLIEVIGAPYELGGDQVSVQLSIGIALAPGDGLDPDQLLKNADMALYRAKSDGHGLYRFFEPEMDARMQARRTLEIGLRKAIVNGEFELFYQPLVDMQTEYITGFEALIRWHHPERGMIPPLDFIPVAEETGLIVPIGDWVLRQACAEAVTWPGDLKIAVNLSPIQFKSKGLLLSVVSALAASGLPANRLELEITESVLLQDSDATLTILHELRGLGIRISMDDFGTGYSSLSYLRKFPFDKIKIDQSFIVDMSDHNDSLAIVRAVIAMGSGLGIATTAEGVETVEQFKRLKLEGCAEVQGYLFSPPRPAADVNGLLASINPTLKAIA